MKRIVILCDGTWNSSDAKDPTNVVRLARALRPQDDKGVVQVPIYIEGVGTGRGITRLGRWSDKFLGGALGWGLMDNVIEAYRHLVFLYEPDDEIYIFGFSRGAFTARSLAGFVRSTGIIDRDFLHHLPEAVARYRTRGDKTKAPDSQQSWDFRSRVSLRVVTSEDEAEHRAKENMPAAPMVQLAYLGVWDTVGALGVPKQLRLTRMLTGGKYAFHNTKLSRMVKSARHAIALDERRRTFEPTRWTLSEELKPLSIGDDAPYQEKFFPGDHGSVGGGGDIRDLSSIALEWIIEGAVAAKLAFEPAALNSIRRDQDPTGPLHNFTVPRTGLSNWITRRNPADRDGPDTIEELHRSVHERWARTSKVAKPYRPGSLKRVDTQLAALHGDEAGGQDPDRIVT